MRLDKFLADCSLGTRSELKKIIKGGRVKVNGIVAKDSAMKIDEYSDSVTFDGQEVSYEKLRYFMFNKPAGCVSATRDKLSETVIAYLKEENIKGLFPVGRLDKDTEGLLLITNDGPLCHDLLSPKKHVDKTYIVIADKVLTDKDIELMEKGIDIGDEKPCLPASLSKIAYDSQPMTYILDAHKDDLSEDGEEVFNGSYPAYSITIHEGRFHQIKRMFEACGSRVLYLKRISMGKLKLDDNLAPGEYKKINLEDII